MAALPQRGRLPNPIYLAEMPGGGPLVSGELLFGEGQEAFSKGTAYVRLEDVSRADAPSHVVAEQVIPNISYQPGQPGRFRFELHGVLPDAPGRYVLSAHLDVDGDGRISRGDYINMESYPVLTQGHPRAVVVQLRKIK